MTSPPRGVAMVLGAVLAVTAVACGGSDGPKASSTRSGFEVGRMTQTFVDGRRPTPANGNAPAQPVRTLETTFLYPTDAGAGAGDSATPVAPGGPFPLIVFAHGFTGTPAAYDKLLQAWAAAGYVVVAPSFPLTNANAPGGPTPNDLSNQPGDVSFLITQVLLLTRGDGPLRGAVDPGRIALAGHSMGGFTTLGVVRNTCCLDDRVKAAVVLAGNEVPFPNGRFSVQDPTPILFVHGDADAVVPYGGARQAFAGAVAPKFFVTLLGADHVRAYAGGNTAAAEVVVRTTLDFFDRYLRGRIGGLTKLRDDGRLAGVAATEAVER